MIQTENYRRDIDVYKKLYIKHLEKINKALFSNEKIGCLMFRMLYL